MLCWLEQSPYLFKSGLVSRTFVSRALFLIGAHFQFICSCSGIRNDSSTELVSYQFWPVVECYIPNCWVTSFLNKKNLTLLRYSWSWITFYRVDDIFRIYTCVYNFILCFLAEWSHIFRIFLISQQNSLFDLSWSVSWFEILTSDYVQKKF